MSISEEINRIKNNISDTYSALETKGATIPEAQNTDNLAAAVLSISTGSQGLPFGTCTTAQATTAKIATVDGMPSTLTNGTAFFVRFQYASVSSATLKVNNFSAYPIRRYGTTATSTSGNGWNAGAIVLLIYYENAYYFNYWTNSTYSTYSLGIGYGTCATAYATTAKVVTHTSYTLVNGGINAVKFTNDVCANATMNINSKGAKPIFYKGAAIKDKIIKAGDVALFIYDNTNYNLLTCDSWQGGGQDMQALTETEIINIWQEA